MASRSKVRGPTFAENLEVLISSLKVVVSVQLPVFRISEKSLFYSCSFSETEVTDIGLSHTSCLRAPIVIFVLKSV